MIDLRGNPFFLDDEAVTWVESTLASMTMAEKAGQVFCPMGFASDENVLRGLVQGVGIGGLMYRADFAANIRDTHEKIQSLAQIPLLLAANTEAGGDGLAFEGTSFGQPMAVAATGDPENAYRMGYVAAKEGAALGLNWSFAPIVDIDMDFHNPITNVRTFGSDPDKVIANASRYMDGCQENGVAVAIKHFPGDGADERDQHILTSVNSLSCEAWDETFGKVYGSLIAQGAQTVMVGHIAQPSYTKALKADATCEEMLLPASLNPTLLQGLLRGKLGFNGMIVTDSTPMVGFTAAMPRSKAIPAAIAAGADMILFNKDLQEDYGFLMAGIQDGTVTLERLDEAVKRILATKASLKLHKKQLVPGAEALGVVGCPIHRAWAKKVADDAITLVRDKENLLPISPKKFPRVYLNVIQKDLNPENPVVQNWKALFEKEGFQVTLRDRRVSITVQDFITPELPPEKGALMHEMYRSVAAAKESYDLYVYICNMENASNNTILRLNWNVCFGLGDDAPWFAKEVPTLMISTACPYHLFDAPMVGTYINAYSGKPHFCSAVMERLMGRAEFTGISPVDPFCGKEYLRW